MTVLLPVILIVLLVLVSSLRVLKEYERGVMFSFGRYSGVKGPGVRLVWPLAQQMKRLELRTVVLNVPKQDVISRDNVSVKVSAVIYFRIVDPEKAVLQVVNPVDATSQLAQTTLRSVLGQHEMDEMLAQRDKLNASIQQILDLNTEAWGMKVSNVEIKDIDLDETMIRAMARQAEAERSRRAKIIHAEGEKQAAQTLLEAAKLLALEPASLQLRYMQTLSDITNEKTSTIVFPLPIDLVTPLLRR
jgi:regulator of protease activity HflC (stomatin/prohibitin superfamily)